MTDPEKRELEKYFDQVTDPTNLIHRIADLEQQVRQLQYWYFDLAVKQNLAQNAVYGELAAPSNE